MCCDIRRISVWGGGINDSLYANNIPDSKKPTAIVYEFNLL